MRARFFAVCFQGCYGETVFQVRVRVRPTVMVKVRVRVRDRVARSAQRKNRTFRSLSCLHFLFPSLPSPLLPLRNMPF